MAVETREGRVRGRLTPVRQVKYNLNLTPAERDELDRRAVESGFGNAADYVRRQLFTGGEPRSAA